ncbi:MAG: hypothetical protein LBE05_04840 [Microbacterium sp.]|jgi:hypothetical protein|nr:hypothetical protein [Microbacterium sp.]
MTEPTFREALADALTLPDGWTLAPYENALDHIDRPTLLLRYEGFELAGVDARTHAFKHNFQAVLISPVSGDTEAADADLDQLLSPAMDALNAIEWVQVTTGEKRTWNDLHSCFQLTLNFYAPL